MGTGKADGPSETNKLVSVSLNEAVFAEYSLPLNGRMCHSAVVHRCRFVVANAASLDLSLRPWLLSVPGSNTKLVKRIVNQNQ